MIKKENAVSPVIGVLLMLVITIIIAAVVSGFAGNMVSGQKSAPSVSMDITIKNTGEWRNSAIQFTVKSISEPIPTKDLKIYTEWTNASGISGGNITAKGLNDPNTVYSSYSYQSPGGYGPGTKGDQTSYGGLPAAQHFGNYTLMAGTTMRSNAAGSTTATNGGYGINGPLYSYNEGNTWTSANEDGVMAILGNNWNSLRPGDAVTVKILHIPSGKFIYTKNVMVE